MSVPGSQVVRCVMTDVTPARFAHGDWRIWTPRFRDNIGADGGGATVEGCAEAPSIGCIGYSSCTGRKAGPDEFPPLVGIQYQSAYYMMIGNRRLLAELRTASFTCEMLQV